MKYINHSRPLLIIISVLLIISLIFPISGCAEEAKETTVTGVSPGSAKVGETLDVTITGTNLTDASAVSFGSGVTINSFTVDSATRITASISIAADAAVGSKDVSVTTELGTGTKTGGFTVAGLEAPTVTGVSPDSGDQINMLDVTITGTTFTDASAVSFGSGITVDSFTVDSDIKITANIAIAIDATEGSRDVSVTNPDGTGIMAGGFTVNKQEFAPFSLATWESTTTSYTVGLALEQALENHTDLSMSVEPAISDAVNYARMADGEVEFLVSGGTGPYGVITGTLGKERNENVRWCFYTYTTNQAFVVRPDSGIDTVYDLMGKKVDWVFTISPSATGMGRKMLEVHGINPDTDIETYEHDGLGAAYTNLGEGRVDAFFGTAVRFLLSQLAASGGVKLLPIEEDKINEWREDYPFYFPGLLPEGFPGAAEGNTMTTVAPYGVVSSTDASEDLVYLLTKTLLENAEEVQPAHTELVNFMIENATRFPVIPFHDGAIRYFKEAGIWTAELEDFQQNALALAE
jgi:TRAP transporter TAXI family solute receptor